MKLMIKSLRLFLLILIFYFSSFAKLSGEGEITGEVAQSWFSDERVIFSLKISNQTNDRGPRIGNQNNFVYAGADEAEITAGDVVKFRYNSDDEDGIIVEKLEFIDNHLGETKRTQNLLLIIVLCGGLLGLIMIVGAIIYQGHRTKIKN